MISPSDKEYILTKQIMLGKTMMNQDFRPLADFIDAYFNVKTINIVCDEIKNFRYNRKSFTGVFKI